MCDIAPLGIAVAKAAGLPSVLVENFTWDWIYEGYLAGEPRLARHLPYLTEMFQAADFHIQTRPVCDPQPVDLVTAPVSRKSRTSAVKIREQLEVPDHARMVMVTMGGGTWDFSFIEQLKRHVNCRFVIAGNGDHLSRTGNVLMLPRHSSYFHPDLVGASDVVIGKVGYSTIAEVYQAGVPFGYVSRRRFRETPPLQRYIEQTMPGIPLDQAAFADGSWLAALPNLLALPRRDAVLTNGADQIAAFVGQVLSR